MSLVTANGKILAYLGYTRNHWANLTIYFFRNPALLLCAIVYMCIVSRTRHNEEYKTENSEMV